MARARNIKPALFKNEILGVEDPLLSLLFISLWCLADKEGKLEDRPLRIKAETFPYRENLDINGYLTKLVQHGFIRRYAANGMAIIQVIKFKEHQSPHNTEKPSSLPDYDPEIHENKEQNNLTVNAPLNIRETTEQKRPDSLIPDSLIPDSLIPDSLDKVLTHTDYPSQQSREPTPAASVCLELKKNGIIDLNPAHPKLLMLIEAGATIDEFMHAARTAKDKGKGFLYVLGIVEGQRTEAAQAKDKVLQGTIQNKADALLNRNKESTRNWKPPELRAQNDGT